MTRKNKTRYGLARSYRITPTVKLIRVAIMASVLTTVTGTVCAAPLPAFNTGISVNEPFNDVVINNIYDYTVDASFSATGISGIASYGDVTIDNSGDLDVYADGYYGSSFAYGIVSSAYGDSHVTNSGNINVTAHTSNINFNSAEAQGIKSFANKGDSIVTNDGTITIDIASTATSIAFGINTYSGDGNVDIHNNGNISIIADAGGWALVDAINVFNRSGYVDVFNSGDISIITKSDYRAETHGIDVYTTDANVDIINSGDITIDSSASSYSDAVAINSRSRFGINTVENIGDLNVVASSSELRANAGGIATFADGGSISIENMGNINLVSEATHSYASAWGIITAGAHQADVFNGGDIDIEISAHVAEYNYSQSLAYGIYSQGALSTIENTGDITIAAYSNNGVLYASGVSIDSVRTNVKNTGSISIEAYSVIDQARSIGIDIDTLYDAVIVNSGDITITSDSGTGTAQAYGIRAYSQDGDINLNNSGNITVTSEFGIAYAVSLNGYYGAVFSNSGSIRAFGDEALAIKAEGGGLTLNNTGAIFGNILTDAGSDNITNAVGGRMYMNNSSINLGTGVNTFINNGKLFVNGANNVISVGSGNLFTNNGNSIHMDDGSAGDSLAIAGNFNGSGGLYVDINGANLTTDTLFINGNVIAGTTNTITINLISQVALSDIANGAEITIVSVSGNSQASNFVLNPIAGEVNGLYTFDYSLNYSSGDYSLGFDFGISGLGALVTTLSPAIQNIWYNNIGTLNQREGSARSFLTEGEDSGGGVWARIYGIDGAYKPYATNNTLSENANADFDMSGTALEAGIGYAFNKQLVVGAIIGTSDTDVNPVSGGQATVNANTMGVYISYLPNNGFYADLSYRWMDFDGDGRINTDRIDYQGKASGFSLEVGYAYKSSFGLEIEPQVQFSNMVVDMDNIDFNNTDFQLNDGDSTQLRAGLALRKEYSTDWGKWTPYGALSYVDLSGSNNDYSISGVIDGSVDMSGSSGLLELGLTASTGSWTFAGGINWQDGGAFDSVLSSQLNVKYTW